jgi:hypothetical protein
MYNGRGLVSLSRKYIRKQEEAQPSRPRRGQKKMSKNSP